VGGHGFWSKQAYKIGVLADGLSDVRGVLDARPRHPARLSSVRLPQGPDHPPDQAYCDAGNVNSAGRLNLVIESVRPDTKHIRDSIDPAHADGAGGSLID
jgi:hypothetical protein